MAYDTRGRHVVADAWGCSFHRLNDAKTLAAVLTRAAREACMTVLQAGTEVFQPHGCTVFVVLSESHLSIHTYPEAGYAAIDAFTCGNGDAKAAVDAVLAHLAPAQATMLELSRGDAAHRAFACRPLSPDPRAPARAGRPEPAADYPAAPADRAP